MDIYAFSNYYGYLDNLQSSDFNDFSSIRSDCKRHLPNLIVKGLYLGDYTSTDTDILKKLNITHVVSMLRMPIISNINHLVIPWLDSPHQNIFPDITKAYKFIDTALKQGKNVLVHCFMGVSRSATAVIYYIMVKYKISFEEALDYVRKRRSCINPNIGFVRQLKSVKIYTDLRNKKPILN